MKVCYLIISSLFLLFGTCYAQQAEENNYIFWDADYKLVWTDFEKLPERFSEHGAFSVIGYEGHFNMTDEKIRAIIKTYFDKDESWSKNWIGILLTHEQTHFDLAELYARKFRQRLKKAMLADQISVSKFKELNNEAIQILKDAQKEYDVATNYSLDYRAQMNWTNKIQEELKQLKNFADPEIVVYRKTQ